MELCTCVSVSVSDCHDSTWHLLARWGWDFACGHAGQTWSGWWESTLCHLPHSRLLIVILLDLQGCLRILAVSSLFLVLPTAVKELQRLLAPRQQRDARPLQSGLSPPPHQQRDARPLESGLSPPPHQQRDARPLSSQFASPPPQSDVNAVCNIVANVIMQK